MSTLTGAIEFDAATHTYRVNGRIVPSVTQIITSAGLSDYSHVAPQVLELACDFGRACHLACELWDNGELDEAKLDVALVPYLDGWKKFCDHYATKILSSEKRVASAKYGYAGTADKIAVIGGDLCIIDLKTSTAVAPCTALQTAAYQQAYEESTGNIIGRRFAVQLLPGAYKITGYKDKSDFRVFLSALQIHNWKANHNV